MSEIYYTPNLFIRKSSVYRIFCFLSSSALALILAFIDVFLAIDFLQIEDRINYLTLASNSSLWITETSFFSPARLILDEPVFKSIFFVLDSIGVSPIGAIRWIIFFSSLVTFYVLQTKGGIAFHWCVLLLFFDWFVANYINSVRMAFATSLFLIAHFYLRGFYKFSLLVAVALIHYSFLIVYLLFILTRILKQAKFSTFYSTGFTGVAGFVFGSNFEALVSAFGFGELARRYIEFSGSISLGLGVVFVILIWLIFMMQGSIFKAANLFSIQILTFYLSTVIFFPPVSRVLISTICLILVAGFSLKGYYRALFIALIAGYSMIFTLSGKFDGAVFFF